MWLEYARDYTENIWKYSDVGCATVSKDGTTITKGNQYLCTTLEYTTLEIEGTHVDLVTAEEYRGTGVAEIRRVIAGDLPFFEQVKFYVTKTGKRIKAKTQSFPIYDANGALDHFFSIVHFVFNGTSDNSRVAVMEQELITLRGLVQALAGKNDQINVVHGDSISGGTADRSASISVSKATNGESSSFKWMALVVALIVFGLLGFGALAMNGYFKLDYQGDGKGTVEIESQP